jgi:hypothetical protein
LLSAPLSASVLYASSETKRRRRQRFVRWHKDTRGTHTHTLHALAAVFTSNFSKAARKPFTIHTNKAQDGCRLRHMMHAMTAGILQLYEYAEIMDAFPYISSD